MKVMWWMVFTGLVEETGTLERVRRGVHSAVLTIAAEKVMEHTRPGDSIAVNGICLTVTSRTDRSFTADVMHETLNRSSLSGLRPGARVNLERAMAADGRFGGHIVSGHVDGVGRIINIRRDDNAHWYTIAAAPNLLRYIVEKGSITIDGISLTVGRVTERDFAVSVIPHTAAVTTLGEQRPGDVVNLETDVLGKYVEKLLNTQPAEPVSSGISMEYLRKNGF